MYCVAYAADGSRFASGGADKTVIIWGSDGQGLLKFTHSTTIQALAFNPVTLHLASASESDYGFWAAELKSVPKKPVTACIRCLAWSGNGQQLAIGLDDGRVLLVDKAGTPRHEIVHGSEAVWSLTFLPTADERQLFTLVVASWKGTLAFYDVRNLSA